MFFLFICYNMCIDSVELIDYGIVLNICLKLINDFTVMYQVYLYTRKYNYLSWCCNIIRYRCQQMFKYMFMYNIIITLPILITAGGRRWSWSYGSWIYNYLCNHCLSPLTLWVRTPFMASCTLYNFMWSSLWVTCGSSVVFSGYSGLLCFLWVPPGFLCFLYQ